MAERKTCGASWDGRTRCGQPVEPLARLGLCRDHITMAYDYLNGHVGQTDVLRWPCAACGSRLGVHWPSGWLCAVCEWRQGVVPDPDDVPPRVDVVYYLCWRDRIKIGTSSNPRMRLAQLRYDTVLAFERGGRGTEQKRHAQFADSRFVGSEWFRSTPELETHVAALAAGVEDPWDEYKRWLSETIALRL